jgi:hypothetical protein
MRFPVTSFVSIASLVLLGAPVAHAATGPFAGTIELKITTDAGGNGTVKMTIGDAGTVNDLQMSSPQGAVAIKSLTRKDKPDVVYIINDAQKQYLEVPAKAPPGAVNNADETWTIKKIGTDTVAGFKSVHVTGVSSKGNSVELWSTKDVMDSDQYEKAMGADRGRLSGNMMQALKKEDADGFPVKLVAKPKEGGTTTMELVKVTKGALPATTFDVPSGYAKATLPNMPPPGSIPPDVQKKIDERMKAAGQKP